MPRPEPIELWFADVLVGRLRQSTLSDGTWDAAFDISGDTVNGRRLAAFIVLCKDWNRRVRAATKSLPDPDEFNPFDDLVTSSSWRVRFDDGAWQALDGAPNFFDDAVRWRPTHG